MQSVLTRARDQSRFVAPVIEEEVKRRPLPIKGLGWGAILLAVLGVAIGTIYVTQFRPVEIDPDTIVHAPSAPANEPPPVTTQTPQEIVQEYFTALSNGQVDRAIAMGTPGEGSRVLLTDAAFSRAREALPITDVEVLSDDPVATDIPVRYRVGGTPHETTIKLTLLDNGEYQLERSTTTAEFSVPGGQNLPLLINGVAVEAGQPYEVLPGLYVPSTGLPFIEYTETSELEVPGVGREAPYSVNVTPELTDAGETALIDAARESLRTCIAQHTMLPEGCPNRAAPSEGVAVDSSARWGLTNNPWAAASPRLTAEDQSVALVRVPITTTLSFSYSDGGTSNGRPITTRADVRASMAGTDPAGIQVTWSVG